MIIYTPTNKRPIHIQFEAINAVYFRFEKEFVEITSNLNTYGISNRAERLLYNRYIRLKENFKNVL